MACIYGGGEATFQAKTEKMIVACNMGIATETDRLIAGLADDPEFKQASNDEKKRMVMIVEKKGGNTERLLIIFSSNPRYLRTTLKF